MQKKWPRAPEAVLDAFRQRSGWSPRAGISGPTPPMNSDRLLQGLMWLESWDHRAVLARWSGPLLALAARDDLIVPPKMAEACFSHLDLGSEAGLHWLEQGGHLLPLSRPGWCAARVLAFLAANPRVEQ